LRLSELVTLEGECIGVVQGQVFFEGMDCVVMVLGCALEVGFLGVLGGMVVSTMLVGGKIARTGARKQESERARKRERGSK